MQSIADIPTVDVLGFPVADVDMQEAVAATAALLQGRDDAGAGSHGARIVTANAEILYRAHKDAALGQLLHSAALIVPDGIGVVKAAARLGRPLKERVAGADLMERLSAWAAENSRSVYLLGAAKESVEGAAAVLQARYPGLAVVGVRDGYFKEIEKESVLRDIQEKKPDFLFVAMGFPAQDRFYEEHKACLPASVMMGVGGTFDALSGRVKRAPLWIQRINMEWAYRFAQNPKRLGRIWALPAFLLAVRRQKKGAG